MGFIWLAMTFCFTYTVFLKNVRYLSRYEYATFSGSLNNWKLREYGVLIPTGYQVLYGSFAVYFATGPSSPLYLGFNSFLSVACLASVF